MMQTSYEISCSPPARSAAGELQRSSGGFSLLEVLVALVVLSVGLLGLASLQANTIQFNQSAYLRSQATALAYDMADRMRANREAAFDGDYDSGMDGGVCGAAVAAGAVADEDLDGWRNALACALPLGEGSVDVDDGVVTVTVEWAEARGQDGLSLLDDADAGQESFVMTTGL